ncbi:MAG: hypothetical protein M1409_06215 [Actinobacteria bacterium]|nr:hypothetical protein [Actinomycetota bacterium]
MNQDLNKIKKIAFISLIFLFVIGIISFFITSLQIFLAIIIGEILTFIFFVGTLFLYSRVYNNGSPNKIRYILYTYAAKILLAGLVFFLIARFDYINLIGFTFSFLILFTVFFNLEIFLIYKKVLFNKN